MQHQYPMRQLMLYLCLAAVLSSAAANAVAVVSPTDPTHKRTPLPNNQLLCADGSIPSPIKLHARPQRFTPADGNDRLASTSLRWAGGDATLVEVLTTQNCTPVAQFRPARNQSLVQWGGKSDKGDPVEPGSYVIRLQDSQGRYAYSLVVVGNADDACQSERPVRLARYKISQQSPHMPDATKLSAFGGGRLCLDIKIDPIKGAAPTVLVDNMPAVQPSDVPQGVTLLKVGVPAGPAPEVRFGGSGNYSVIVKGLATQRYADVPVRTPTAFTCKGQLLGFAHPFLPELPRRQIRRGGVPIRCTVRFGPRPNEASAQPVLMTRQVTARHHLPDIKPFYPTPGHVPYKAMLPNIPGLRPDFGGGLLELDPLPIPTGEGELVSVVGFTKPNGSFEIGVTEADLLAAKIHANQPLHRISASCGDSYSCAWAPLGSSAPDQAGALNLAVSNIPDYYDGSLEGRLVTNVRPGINDASLADTNNFPVVIHEPFDPFWEDGTDNLIWLLAGQPTNLVDRENNPIQPAQLCSDAPRTARCSPFRDGCRWTPNCNSTTDGVFCSQTNVLKPMLDAGYDVWLVNHTAYDMAVTQVAAAAPKMYQAVIDYPSKDSNRHIAVGGLSAGGVAARIALRLWERKAELPMINGDTLEHFDLRNPTEFSALPNQVALYLSFDAPHLGATLPQSLQGYLKDSKFAGRDSGNLDDLVNSRSAQELLSNYIQQPTRTACFVGEDQVRNCKLSYRTEAIQQKINQSSQPLEKDFLSRRYIGGDQINRQLVDDLMNESITIASPDGTNILDAFVPDGLPKSIPSIAIANGALSRVPRNAGNDHLMSVIVKILNTRRQHLHDLASQPAGSSLPLCQANNITASLSSVMLYQALADYCEDKTSIFGPLSDLAKYTCGLVGAFDPTLHQVDVSVDVELGLDPTFVPSNSALISPAGLTRPALGWEDALWPDSNQTHFTVTEDACRFALYHLDGYLKGDRDGVPACSANVGSDCAAGGRRPGKILDPAQSAALNMSQYCDCDDADPERPALEGNRCQIRATPEFQIEHRRLDAGQ